MPHFTDVFQSDANGVYTVPGVGEVIDVQEAEECMICRRWTWWFEICAEGPICSTECSKKFWEELNEACRKSNERSALGETHETGSEGCAF